MFRFMLTAGLGTLVVSSAALAVPAGWEVTQLTDNDLTDQEPRIGGGTVVWQQTDANFNNQVHYYDLNTGTSGALTNNSVDDDRPDVFGSTVAWERERRVSGVDQSDIVIKTIGGGETYSDSFLGNTGADDYDPSVGPGGVAFSRIEGTDVQIYTIDGGSANKITSTTYFNENPEMSDTSGDLVWEGADPTRNEADVFAYDASAGTTHRLTNNSEEVDAPAASGDLVIATAPTATGDNLFLYDTSNDTTTQLTDTSIAPAYPRISGETVVWQRGSNEDLMVYNRQEARSFLLNGGKTGVADEEPDVHNGKIVWRQTIDGQDSEIMLAQRIEGPKRITLSLTGDQTVDGLGFSVEGTFYDNSSVAIIEDPLDSSNHVLEMEDPDAQDGYEVAISRRIDTYPADELDLGFDYRFLTDGKLEVLIDGVVEHTINAPDSGEGRDSFASYADTLTVTPGINELTLKLSNVGDPSIHLDNMTAAVPEPGTLALLGLAAPLALRRRRG
jgi:hypothetical protein